MHDPAPYPVDDITGVILAGGEARRMGGEDKGLVRFAGQPMIAHVLAALAPQSATVLINANRNQDVYAAHGCEVIADDADGFNGPLAGIGKGLASARTGWVLFVPCDSPLVSPHLGPRLWAPLAAARADIAMASDGERTHPVFALIRAQLAASAADALARGERKIDRWYAEHATITVSLPELADTFANVNRPEDLARVEAVLAHTHDPKS